MSVQNMKWVGKKLRRTCESCTNGPHLVISQNSVVLTTIHVSSVRYNCFICSVLLLLLPTIKSNHLHFCSSNNFFYITVTITSAWIFGSVRFGSNFLVFRYFRYRNIETVRIFIKFRSFLVWYFRFLFRFR